MKTLIYLEESKLMPKGGPYAVGYYVKEEMLRRGRTDIDFIPDNNINKQPIKISNKLMQLLQSVYRIINRYKRFNRLFQGKGVPKINFSNYDIIHFHKTIDMLECKSALDDFKGKVILTSHSPVPLSKEFYDEYLLPFERKFMGKFYSNLIKMDEYAFTRADYIQFPCEESEDPYINNWDNYVNIKKARKSNYIYIPTGIPSAISKRDRTEVRKELNIPDSDFCISYVGRHNVVKGYDKLKEIGERILQDKSIWVIVAGREAPLHRLNNSNWIEIGWTDDAYSYIASSDVFVLPNKETYFDIVMLEVLSLGKIVVASRTGGNRYFERFKESGIFLYDNIDEAIKILSKIRVMTKSQREHLGALNKAIFENNFTNTIFVDRYLKFIDSIR